MGLTSELPDNLKPNYSVLGENANDIIRLKELHEDAIIDYLGDTSRTGDADNFSFWGGADHEDANKAFNKVVIDIAQDLEVVKLMLGVVAKKNIMILLKNMQMQEII